MTVLMTFATVVLVLVVGDFLSTFFYHVPQHLWFTLHLRTHHDRRRSYWDHAILSTDSAVLLDGILGALPYIAVAASLWHFSATGAVIGLLLGQLHVWWRHTVELGWVTPQWVVAIARPLQIVLPEDHNGHHLNPDVEFGDLFRFYDAPARLCLRFVRAQRRLKRRALRRLKGESVKA